MDGGETLGRDAHHTDHRIGGRDPRLRYRFVWTAWLGGRLLGQGHAFDLPEAEGRAMDLLTDLLTPEQVGHIDLIER